MRVLSLRPDGHGGGLRSKLEDAGFAVVEVPGVAIEPGDVAAIDDAIGSGGDWAVFVSASAVDAVAARAPAGLTFRRVAAVGDATATALRNAGFGCDWTPPKPISGSLARELPAGGTVTVFRSSAGTTDLEDVLRIRGFDVRRVDAYRSFPCNAAAVREALATGIDAALVTSASVAGTLAIALAGDKQPIIVSIGPVTTAAANQHGLRVDAEAATATDASLVEALASAVKEHAR